MELLIKRYQELDFKKREALSKIVSDEFSHVPIVKKYEWATPDWVLIIHLNEKIVFVAHVVLRDVYFDNKRLKVGGLSNVITLKHYRGKGIAGEALKSIHTLIINSLKCETGLLLCR